MLRLKARRECGVEKFHKWKRVVWEVISTENGTENENKDDKISEDKES